MIGPDLCPRSRAAFDRTHRLAQNYYRAWGARVRAEREARKLSQAIPDELMNEFSDSDDEKVMQLNRHAPTPVSMPSSPILTSMPKPIDTNMSIKSSIIESKHSMYDGRFSPVDIDGESSNSASWQSSSRSSNHQSVARRSSVSVEPALLSTILTRSRTCASTKFFHLASSGHADTNTRKHARQSASRTTSSKMYSTKDSGAGLRHVQRGRVAKRRS